MSEPRFRPASRPDIDVLVPVVRQFYADEGIPWDEAMLREALDALLSDPANGRLLLIERDGALAGYIVIGFCFSLEFGGRYGLLDELYVLPSQRGGGLGKLALAEVEALCLREGLRAVRLEVSDDNEHAHGIYQRSGYDAHPRRLMTRWLDESI
ncbi:GNAT family N-acetyltransferase [Pseudoxanthomonas beigongshangi]